MHYGTYTLEVNEARARGLYWSDPEEETAPKARPKPKPKSRTETMLIMGGHGGVHLGNAPQPTSMIKTCLEERDLSEDETPAGLAMQEEIRRQVTAMMLQDQALGDEPKTPKTPARRKGRQEGSNTKAPKPPKSGQKKPLPALAASTSRSRSRIPPVRFSNEEAFRPTLQDRRKRSKAALKPKPGKKSFKTQVEGNKDPDKKD